MLRGHETTLPGFTRCLLKAGSADASAQGHGRRAPEPRCAPGTAGLPRPGAGARGGRPGRLRSEAGAAGGALRRGGSAGSAAPLKPQDPAGSRLPSAPPDPDPAAQPPAEG